MTLRACYEMDYPAYKITCWVCDDGNSADMREMVKQVAQWEGGMTTQYVARVKTPVSSSSIDHTCL
jgi:cellulose synthase/poly-beta-1,6-N-acetylglucosamine synthase-like glycosyltransferase